MADVVEKLSVVVDYDGVRLSNGTKMGAGELLALGKEAKTAGAALDAAAARSDEMGDAAKTAATQVQVLVTYVNRASDAAKTAGTNFKAMERDLPVGGVRGLTAELANSTGAIASQTDAFMNMKVAGVASVTAIAAGAALLTQAVFAASAASQRLNTQLNFATNGNGARELGFVTELANRLGLELNSTAKAYAGFASAARGTALEGEAARKVFESIAGASAVMGLSADETNGALLAVQQMMSKGTVQAEEFRGQLGERMPIALQAGARALGVTTAEFNKMMESGQVVAQDFLPKFASAINLMLGDSVEQAANRLDASTARMGNAWERLKKTVGDSGVATGAAKLANAASNDMTAMSEAMELARLSGAGFFGQMNAGIGMLLGRSVNLQSVARNFMTLNAAVSDAKATIEDLNKAELRQGALSIYQLDRRAQAYRDLARAQAALAATQPTVAGVGGGRGTVNPQTVAQAEAELNKNMEAKYAVMLKLSSVTDGYIKDMQEIVRLNQAGVLVGEEYTRALAKMQELRDKKTGEVTKVDPEIEARRRVLAELSGYEASYEESARRLVGMRKSGVLSEQAYLRALQDLLDKQPLMREAAREQEDAAREVQRNRDAAATAATRAYEVQDKEIEGIVRGNAALELQIASVGKTRAAINELKAARLDSAIAAEQERLSVLGSFDNSEQARGQIERKIEALKREQELTRQLGTAEQDERAAAAATKAFEAQDKEIEALVRGNEALELQIASVGKTKDAINELKAARLDGVIAAEQERLSVLGSADGSEKTRAQIERKIAELQRQQELMRGLGTTEQADEVRRANEAESKRYSEDLRRDLSSALMRAFESGKSPAQALADTFANTVQSRLMAAVVNGLVNPMLNPMEQAIGGSLSGIFSGWSWGGSGSSAATAGGGMAGAGNDFGLVVPGNHGGGMAGAEATFMRRVRASAFDGAPRLHTGGIAGDEVPIIAKRGEGVFTAGQMAALAPVGQVGQGGQGAGQVTVNVYPTAGQTADVQQRSDGKGGMSIEVILRQVEQGLAERVSGGVGALQSAMSNRFGLRTVVS